MSDDDGDAAGVRTSDTPSVAVVGGGAVGVTVAHDLASWGLDVTVYERDTIAADASGRAAGVLYDAYAEDIDAELGARSMDRFERIAADASFGFQRCPYVFCARTGDDDRAEAIRRSSERMRDHGLAVETLSGSALGERFPTLRTTDIAVAGAASTAGYADTTAYTTTLADRARRAGTTIHTNTPVALRTDPLGVDVTSDNDSTDGGAADDPDSTDASRAPTDAFDGSFDAVVVAAGARTPDVLSSIDLGVATTPYRVQALTARVADDVTATGASAERANSRTYAGPMVYDATAGVYVRPHPTGLLAGDGTVPEPADPKTYDRSADEWFRADTCDAVRHRLGIEPSVERSWAGVCTATPDGDPMLGRLRDGVYVVAGWQGHGFMRSPAHGELLAAQVARDLGVPADRRRRVTDCAGGDRALDAFDPTRYDPDTTFQIREGMVVETD